MNDTPTLYVHLVGPDAPSTATAIATPSLAQDHQPPLLPLSTPNDPHLLPATKPSWADLLKENRKLGNGMKLRKQEVDTSKMLVLKQEQVLSLECAWGICLIGFILGKFPGMKAFDEVRSSWNVPSQYFFHETGWMVFKFECEADRDLVLANGPYATFGAPWMMKKMPSYFTFDDECFSAVPTWIKLPSLPLECWGDEALSLIASYVGEPIATDQFTLERSKPSYARILVEVDAKKPLTKEVTFQTPSGRVITQRIVYESEPKVCMKCHQLGHDMKSCKGKNVQQRGRSKSRPRTEDLPTASRQKVVDTVMKTTNATVVQLSSSPAQANSVHDDSLPTGGINRTTEQQEITAEVEECTGEQEICIATVEHESVTVKIAEAAKNLQSFQQVKIQQEERRLVTLTQPHPKGKGKEILEEQSDQQDEVEASSSQDDTQSLASFCEGMASEEERRSIASTQRGRGKGKNKKRGKKGKTKSFWLPNHK